MSPLLRPRRSPTSPPTQNGDKQVELTWVLGGGQVSALTIYYFEKGESEPERVDIPDVTKTSHPIHRLGAGGVHLHAGRRERRRA